MPWCLHPPLVPQVTWLPKNCQSLSSSSSRAAFLSSYSSYYLYIHTLSHTHTVIRSIATTALHSILVCILSSFNDLVYCIFTIPCWIISFFLSTFAVSTFEHSVCIQMAEASGTFTCDTTAFMLLLEKVLECLVAQMGETFSQRICMFRMRKPAAEQDAVKSLYKEWNFPVWIDSCSDKAPRRCSEPSARCQSLHAV